MESCLIDSKKVFCEETVGVLEKTVKLDALKLKTLMFESKEINCKFCMKTKKFSFGKFKTGLYLFCHGKYTGDIVFSFFLI